MTFEDLAKMNAEAGQHFFDADTLRWWKTRFISSPVVAASGNCVYFVTSDAPFRDGGRKYFVRVMSLDDKTVNVINVYGVPGGLEGEFPNRATAIRVAKKWAAEH